jgi:hypothetical protein
MNLGPYHLSLACGPWQGLPDVQAVEVAAEQKLYPWRPSREHLGFPLTTLFQDRACESVPPRKQCEAVTEILSRINQRVVVTAGYRAPVMRGRSMGPRGKLLSFSS